MLEDVKERHDAKSSGGEPKRRQLSHENPNTTPLSSSRSRAGDLRPDGTPATLLKLLDKGTSAAADVEKRSGPSLESENRPYAKPAEEAYDPLERAEKTRSAFLAIVIVLVALLGVLRCRKLLQILKFASAAANDTWWTAKRQVHLRTAVTAGGTLGRTRRYGSIARWDGDRLFFHGDYGPVSDGSPQALEAGSPMNAQEDISNPLRTAPGTAK
jgi:hypothetical protein